MNIEIKNQANELRKKIDAIFAEYAEGDIIPFALKGTVLGYMVFDMVSSCADPDCHIDHLEEFIDYLREIKEADKQ